MFAISNKSFRPAFFYLTITTILKFKRTNKLKEERLSFRAFRINIKLIENKKKTKLVMQKPHIYHANHEHLTLHTPVGMKKHTQIYVLIYTVVHLFKLLMTSLFVEHTPNTLIVVAVRTRHCYVVLHTTADRCSIPFRVYTRSYHFIIFCY